MIRREFLAVCGVLLCGGCLSDSEQESQTDSEFTVTNDRNSEVEVSLRLTNGEDAFAVEGFVLAGGETSRFTAGFVNKKGEMSVAAKILSPQEAIYRQDEVPTGVPEYSISIRTDDIDVLWAEN